MQPISAAAPTAPVHHGRPLTHRPPAANSGRKQLIGTSPRQPAGRPGGLTSHVQPTATPSPTRRHPAAKHSQEAPIRAAALPPPRCPGELDTPQSHSRESRPQWAHQSRCPAATQAHMRADVPPPTRRHPAATPPPPLRHTADHQGQRIRAAAQPPARRPGVPTRRHLEQP